MPNAITTIHTETVSTGGPDITIDPAQPATNPLIILSEN